MKLTERVGRNAMAIQVVACKPFHTRLIPNPQEFFITNFRFLPLAAALFAASTLIACNTAPSMPMGSAAAQGTARPDSMGRMDMNKMDPQIKKMRDMHEKMMAARTPKNATN